VPTVAYSAALSQRIDAFARAGYHLYATDLATGLETYLGFVDRTALNLADVALPDGRYRVRVRAQGCFWLDYRLEERFLVAIEGGVPIYPLPVAADFGHSFQLTDTLLRWNWYAAEDTLAPQDWAIWTSLTSPVNTSGAPQYTVPAGGPGQYTAAIAQGQAPLYVALCARYSSSRGAIVTLDVPEPPPALDSPLNQSARFVP
jgi:hypothetical protein